jgi:O-antigen/teichoic acid export membrane protein|tara:strand:+ start:6143 stop:7312 length:1170 start_codon:yes stop_codon:yes gene_type:complete
MLLVPITDTLVIGMIDFDKIGHFSVASLIVQVFVVLSNGLFIGNYVRQGEHTGVSVTASLVTALFSSFLATAALVALAFLFGSGVRSILLFAAPGLIPLFLFAFCASILESSGREGLIFRLTVGVVALNILLNLALVQFIADPAVAVMIATTIARVVLGASAFALVVGSVEIHSFRTLKSEVRVLLSKGIPEASTRVLFVMSMAFTMSYADFRLTELEMSVVGVVLNYMNFLFICGTAVTLASAVELRDEAKKRSIRWFVQYGALSILFIYTFGSFASWFVAVPFPDDVSSFLFPSILIGVIAVCLDAVSNHIVMALRSTGNSRLPPFVRLVMFPILLLVVASGSKSGSETVFLGMAIGNAFALLFLTIILIAKGRGFGIKKHPTVANT